MKLEKIYIKKWHQFENLELDLTYPLDYKEEEMRGQPLKKVCFIGPNGTGKSKLLKLLFEKHLQDYEVELGFASGGSIDYEDPSEKIIYSKPITSDDESGLLDFAFKIPKDTKFLEIDNTIAPALKGTLIAIRFQDFLTKEKGGQSDDFGEVMSQLEIILKRQNIKFASVATDSRFDLLFVDKEGQTVSIGNLSNGTKQIIYRFLPIFYVNPSNSIISIDEPENSLYPTIQKEIVSYYTLVGNDNQFFFATHSPLVAAQFEPCEIFPLDFNENGKVFCDQEKREYLNTANYSADEMLYYWFSTASNEENTDYYAEKQRFQELKEKFKQKALTHEDKKELEKLVKSPLLAKLM